MLNSTLSSVSRSRSRSRWSIAQQYDHTHPKKIWLPTHFSPENTLKFSKVFRCYLKVSIKCQIICRTIFDHIPVDVFRTDTFILILWFSFVMLGLLLVCFQKGCCTTEQIESSFHHNFVEKCFPNIRFFLGIFLTQRFFLEKSPDLKPANIVVKWQKSDLTDPHVWVIDNDSTQRFETPRFVYTPGINDTDSEFCDANQASSIIWVFSFDLGYFFQDPFFPVWPANWVANAGGSVAKISFAQFLALPKLLSLVIFIQPRERIF